MKIRNLLIIAAMSSIALISCQSTDISESEYVAQSEIWQKYSVHYAADNSQTLCQAQYRFGGKTGTTLILSSPGSVMVNNEEMAGDERIFRGFVYDHSIDGFQPKLMFNYTNTEGERNVNNLELKRADIVSPPEILDISTTSIINWEGPPAQDKESIRLIIKDVHGNETSVYPHLGSESFQLKPDSYPSFKNGIGEIFIVRTGIYNLQEGTHLGGEMVSNYTSKVYKIEIKGAAPPPSQEMASNNTEIIPGN